MLLKIFYLVFLGFFSFNKLPLKRYLHVLKTNQTISNFVSLYRQRGIFARVDPMELETLEHIPQSGFPHHCGCGPHFSL